MELSEINTKVLLNALQGSRRGADRGLELDNLFTFSLVRTGGVIENQGFSYDEVINELNTREHVPSKNESKLVRQLMVKHKITKEQVYERYGDQFYPTDRTKVSKEYYKDLLSRTNKAYMSKKYVIDSAVA